MTHGCLIGARPNESCYRTPISDFLAVASKAVGSNQTTSESVSIKCQDNAPDLAGIPTNQQPLGGLYDLAPHLTDFADTAAVVAGLDLVISADTSVAHLAGALGRPVWVMLPHIPDWRWLTTGDRTPWYPTMRPFRQDTHCAWELVVAQVAVALQAHIQAR